MAALVVLAFHIGLIYGLEPIFPNGWLAVDFFFALSGYVLARTYEGRLRQSIGLWQFSKKRFFRFWPVVLFGGVIGAPWILASNGPIDAIAIVALNVLLIPYFKGEDIFPLNGPYWSLFYEFVANVAHAFLLSRLDTRKLVVLVIACAIGMLFMGHSYGGLSFGTAPDTFAADFVRVTFSYGLGVLLYRVWQDKPPVKILWPAAILLGSLALIGRGPFDGYMAQLSFVLAVVPLVIAGGLGWDTRLSGLGTLSFPLYAVHHPIVFYCAISGLHPAIAVGFSLAAAALYVALDKRFRFLKLE